jgi:hypothetical protein
VLVRAYAQALGGLFVNEPELGLAPPRWARALFGAAPMLAESSAGSPSDAS